MELELNRNPMACFEPVLETTLFHEETMEMIVPDACPDILQLADTSGTVCLKSKEAQEGRLELSGTVCCAVLYQPDDGSGMHRVEVNLPFFCSAAADRVTGACSVTALPRVQSADTRVLNPRKVLVRVNLAIEVCAFLPSEAMVCAGAAATEENGLQQLMESHECYVVSAVQEKPFTFSDDLTLSGSRPEAEELLKTRVQLDCAESKVIGNKLIFKGEAVLQLLYRSTEGQVCSCDFSLPFSQIMEVSGAEEESDCAVEVQLTGLSCALAPGDGRTISVSLELLAQAVVRQPRTVELLADLYSIRHPISVQFASYSLHQLVEQGTRRQSVREIVEVPVLAKNVLDAYVSLGAVTQSREGERLTLSAAAAVSVLCETEDGAVTAVSHTFSVPCPLELPEGCACSCRCRCPGAVYATPTTGGLEIRLDLDFWYLALTPKRVAGVSNAQIEEGETQEGAEQPSIVLRMVGEERLWDIAKAYCTTTDDILRANELGEGESPAGRLLLIPRKR